MSKSPEQAVPVGAISEVEPTLLQEQETSQPQTGLITDVAWVREHGDSIDQLSSIGWRSMAVRAALPIAAVGELSAGSQSLLTTVVAGTTAVAGVAVYSLRKEPGELRAARINRPDREITQSYDLLRVTRLGKRHSDIDIVWYGASKTGSTAQPQLTVGAHLRQVATLAKEAGVAYMHVEDEVAQVARKQLNLPKGMGFPLRKIIQRAKLIAISDTDELHVETRTPDEWLTLTESLAQKDKAQTLKTLEDSLRHIRPEHPLVQMVSSYRNHPEFGQQTLQRFAQRSVERRLEDVEACHNVDLRRAPAGQQAPFVAKIKKYYQSATVVYRPLASDGTKLPVSLQFQARWKTNNQGDILQPLHEALDLPSPDEPKGLNTDGTPQKQNEFNMLLEHPTLDVPRAQRALELAILHAAYDVPVEVTPDTTEHKQAARPANATEVTPKDALMHTLLIEKDERATFTNHRIVQGAAGAALILLAMGGMQEVNQGLDARAAHSAAVAKHKLAREQHVTPDLIQDSDARAAAEKQSKKLRAWNVFTAAEKKLAIKVPGFGEDDADKNNSSVAGATQPFQGVGNTGMGNIPDSTEFALTSHNANTGGMWATSTSSVLEVRNDIGDDSGMGWLPKGQKLFGMSWLAEGNVHPKSDTVLPMKLPSQYAKSWIKVDRDLQKGDSYNGVNDNASKIEKDVLGNITVHAMNIPVLADMVPVAAQIDGKPAVLSHKIDGTYALLNKQQTALSGHLTYWVAPNSKAQNWGTKRPLRITGSDASAPNVAQSQAKIKQMLQKDGSVVAGQNLQAYADALEHNIQTSWKYSYDPFTKNQEQKWHNLADYTVAALANKIANCNVANTLEAIIDPTTQAVFGYNNGNGSGGDILTSHEAHMKRTDGDATPSAPASTPPEAKSTSGLSGRDLLIGASFAFGALAVIRYRRPIVRFAKSGTTYVNARHERQLQTVLPEAAFSAQAVAEHILYARPDMPLRPASITTRATQINSQHSTAEHLINRPDLYSKSTVRAVQRVAGAIHDDPKLTQAILTGTRTLAVARRAAKHRKKLRRA